MRAAIVAHVVYAVHRTEKMPARRVEDFMPRRKAKTPQELLKTVEMINVAVGGRDLRKKDGVRGLDREPVR